MSSELALRAKTENSRSAAVSALSRAQEEYYRQIEAILQEKLPRYLHNQDSTQTEDQAEAAALYAEYAVDFAVQSMRYALIAAMTAIDLQMTSQEQKNASDRKEHLL
ncbi:MAG TPA: hypothetical protein IAB98_09195 [Candidatus Egerieimonas intestinavium]|uniref:Uncharacterized protein n=1 Tax=Candidatus Egerieimonas intestinavium TaxID=2840777 RepID=A0A9D1EKZ0_9FIRM|nr:hypothetical protein [Candidatus Egerieimonas intestinavium]